MALCLAFQRAFLTCHAYIALESIVLHPYNFSLQTLYIEIRMSHFHLVLDCPWGYDDPGSKGKRGAFRNGNLNYASLRR